MVDRQAGYVEETRLSRRVGRARGRGAGWRGRHPRRPAAIHPLTVKRRGTGHRTIAKQRSEILTMASRGLVQWPGAVLHDELVV